MTAPIDWLLDSDPAIRRQVLHDLTDASPEEVAAERARVATEGWGAELLAARDPDGQWMGGACFPGRGGPQRRGARDDRAGDRPLPLGVRRVAVLRRRGRALHQRPYGHHRRLLRRGRRGPRHPPAADQLDDGGWNCETENGATVSSFHSTICVIEGLRERERATGGSPAATEARHRGEEYLLARALLRRRSTGEVPDQDWLSFSFPPRWHYDVLRGLEHFRRADRCDPRLADAVALVRSKRRPDGTWLLENTHPGAAHLRYDDGDGRPSRWNTLRASRVLRWWDAAA
jgi:hypothetical protein